MASDGTISDGRLARDFQLDGAIDPWLQHAVGIGHVDLGQERAGAGLQRVGDARHLSGKVAAGHFRHADDRFNAGRDAEGFVLRDVKLDAEHVALHQGEQERAAGCVRLHERADIDIALRDHAIEGRHHALVRFLLIEHAQLRVLCLDIGLRDRDRRRSRIAE